jgi:hypothetical protein
MYSSIFITSAISSTQTTSDPLSRTRSTSKISNIFQASVNYRRQSRSTRPSLPDTTMKIILTGVTGFIGQEILQQCLDSPAISSIVTLSRRALPLSTPESPKLKVLILKDFTSYPPHVMSELAGAEACVWTLGVKNVSIELLREVSVDYTAAALAAFSKLGSASKPFRFVFMSGFVAERDQTKTLLIYQDARRLKGQGENLVLKDNSGVVDGYVLCPAAVLPRKKNLLHVCLKLALSIEVEALSAATLDLAIQGNGDKIWRHSELVRFGRAALQAEEK